MRLMFVITPMSTNYVKPVIKDQAQILSRELSLVNV